MINYVLFKTQEKDFQYIIGIKANPLQEVNTLGGLACGGLFLGPYVKGGG